jgi:cytochrome c-type biogenesis protein CcmH
MPAKRRRNRLLLALLLTAALAQSSVPLQNPRVRAVGELLMCQCGCKYSVSSCNMQQCHFADPAREELLKLVEAGKSEQEILGAFEARYGKVVLRRPPTEGFFLVGWIMPFAGLAAGLLLVWWLVKRLLRRPAPLPAAAGASPELNRFREQIEKEMSDLD